MAIGQENGRKPLTDLETAVIAAIVQGASDLEVAARLYLSEQAVRRHVRSAMGKWTASDRRQMVSLWADATNGVSSGPMGRVSPGVLLIVTMIGLTYVSAGDGVADRFFRATALAGDLHFIDLRDWDPWEPSRLEYRDEADVRGLVRAGAGERRIIRTTTELGAAIDDSVSPRSIFLYIHESLLEEARSRWEGRRRSPGRALFVPGHPLDNKT